MMTARIIKGPRDGRWHLFVRREPHGFGCDEWTCNMPFGDFSTRPDPIQRAWAAVEAKRAMRGGKA